MSGENSTYNLPCDSLSALDESVDNVIQVLMRSEEEVQKYEKRRQNLEVEVDAKRQYLQHLESKKSELDADITALKLRDAAYQKEHTNLRNAIAVVKYQIEKIKESIEMAKAKELEDLEDFENAVDEITEKFRSGPEIYSRQSLLSRIKEEEERRDVLRNALAELRNTHLEVMRDKGLRAKASDDEPLIDCIFPGSKLSELMKTTRNLDEVICGIRDLITKSEANEIHQGGGGGRDRNEFRLRRRPSDDRGGDF